MAVATPLPPAPPHGSSTLPTTAAASVAADGAGARADRDNDNEADSSHPVEPHSPLSSQSHLSPRLLTPENDIDPPLPLAAAGLTFPKQSLPITITTANPHSRGPPGKRSTSITRGFPRPRPAGGGNGAGAGSDARSRSVAGTDTDGGLSDDPSYLSGLSSGFPDTPRNGSPGKGGQLSLLTALLSSPEHQPVQRRTVKTGPTAAFAEAHPHALSSGPSTALSSPTSAHGILQRAPSRKSADIGPGRRVETDDGERERERGRAADKPHSILRRESVSAASGNEAERRPSGYADRTGMSVGSACLLEQRLKKVDERRERVGWADEVDVPTTAGLARAPSAASTASRPCLKFAVAAKPTASGAAAHAPSHGSTSASEAGEVSRRSSSSHRPASPFAKERKVQESLDEGSDNDQDPDEDEDEDDDVDGDGDEDEATEEDESPANLPGYVPGAGQGLHVIEDDASDAGYQEDEEDGMFSDEEETTAFNLDRIKPGKFPFARSTNYWNRRESRDDTSPGTSPPPAPAPAYIPPPNRRGRGHVRVADQPAPTSGKEGKGGSKEKGCSRHCSPPPRSRAPLSAPKLEIPKLEAPPPAASPSARRLKRPFDRPVRRGKLAGSPMPPKLPVDDDDDEDEDDEEEAEEEGESDDEGEGDGDGEVEGADGGADDANNDELGHSGATPVVARSGWRSDDAVFYGPKSRVSRPASRDASGASQPPVASAAAGTMAAPTQLPPHPVSAPPVFSETEDDSALDADDHDRGVRGFFRRASEHLPILRRPSAAQRPSPTLNSDAAMSTTPTPPLPLPLPDSRDRSTPVSVPSTCRPILDDTPALASSVPRAADGGLAHRLEKTLGTSITVAQLSRPGAGGLTGGVSSGAGRASVWEAPGGGLASAPAPAPASGLAPATDGRRAVSRELGEEIEQEAKRRRDRVRMRDGASMSMTRVTPDGMEKGEKGAEKDKGNGMGDGQPTRSLPMRCPKVKRADGDLGWTDEALLSIRRNVNKAER